MATTTKTKHRKTCTKLPRNAKKRGNHYEKSSPTPPKIESAPRWRRSRHVLVPFFWFWRGDTLSFNIFGGSCEISKTPAHDNKLPFKIASVPCWGVFWSPWAASQASGRLGTWHYNFFCFYKNVRKNIPNLQTRYFSLYVYVFCCVLLWFAMFL